MRPPRTVTRNPTPPPAPPGATASSQYLIYKFAQNSTTITNSGSGGDTYNGTAARAQYAKDSVGYPIWGPLNANLDGIQVPGGIDNPYGHTWQFGININQWWPVNGVIDCVLVGNDGKLFSAGNDLFYAYLHEMCTWNGDCSDGLTQSGQHYLNLEIAYNEEPSYSVDDVQFYLGTESSKPVKQTASTGDEGRIYWAWDNELLLNTNYYFQISVSLEDPGQWAAMPNYCVGNCTYGGSTCSDASVTGFPCGCYIYVWREDNVALDLSGGGNWADDVVLWKGGGPGPGPPTPTPTPGTAPNVNMCVNVREYQPGQE